jgi:DNA-binding MarR family transcriptional regulator
VAAEMTTTAAATDVRWLAPEEQSVWRAFLDVSRLMSDQMNRQLSDESGMSLPEYEILVALSEAPDRRLRMSELADRVLSSRSRITHTVGRMEERGHVHREACADDGRGVLCVLTDAGFAELEAAAPGHVESVRRAMFDPLSGSEVESLGVALRKIREAFGRA